MSEILDKNVPNLLEDNKEHVIEQNKKSTYPTLIVELPSKGLLYPEDHPLSSGKIEMKYMTAKEEDILTTESYIKSGIVLDKLFQSLIVTKVDYDSILLGDKNAIMIAARIYGYGEKYLSKIKTPSGREKEIEVDLNTIGSKQIDESLITKGLNEFTFTTPIGKNVIKFKLLTTGDQRAIDERLKEYKKPGSRDFLLTSRLCQMILSVDGETSPFVIRGFVENDMRALDSRAFREYVKNVQPDVDMNIELIDEETGDSFRAEIAIGLNFFWLDI